MNALSDEGTPSTDETYEERERRERDEYEAQRMLDHAAAEERRLAEKEAAMDRLEEARSERRTQRG